MNPVDLPKSLDEPRATGRPWLAGLATALALMLPALPAQAQITSPDLKMPLLVTGRASASITACGCPIVGPIPRPRRDQMAGLFWLADTLANDTALQLAAATVTPDFESGTATVRGFMTDRLQMDRFAGHLARIGLKAQFDVQFYR